MPGHFPHSSDDDACLEGVLVASMNRPRVASTGASPDRDAEEGLGARRASGELLAPLLLPHDVGAEGVQDGDEWGGSPTPSGAHLTPFTRSPVMFFRQRFSAGSIKGSVFTLVVAIVGAGTLSVPLAVEKAGLLLGGILFVLGGFLAFFSLRLLIISSELAGIKSYSGIALALYGPWADIFAQTCLLLNLYGTSISYMVASGSMLSKVLRQAVGRVEDGSPLPYYLSAQFITIVTTTAVVMPLCLLRTMGALRFSSLIAVGCSVYLTLVVSIEYFSFCLGSSSNVECFWEEQPAGEPIELAHFSFSRMLSAIPIVIYAYTCHPNVLPIFMELQKPTRVRMYKVVGRAIGMACVMYVILGSFGYLTFKAELANTKYGGNFLNNYEDPDAAVIIGAIGMSFSVVLAIPLFVNAFRANLYRLIKGEHADVKRASLPVHVGMSLGFIFAALLPAILIKDISIVFQVLGSTTNPIICFVLPTMFIFRADPSGFYAREKLLSAFVTGIICAISFCALVSNLMK